MYMNGAVIGMAITAVAHRQILKDHFRALTAWTVVAVGSATQVAAEFRVAAWTALATGPDSSGCALPYRIDRERIDAIDTIDVIDGIEALEILEI